MRKSWPTRASCRAVREHYLPAGRLFGVAMGKRRLWAVVGPVAWATLAGSGRLVADGRRVARDFRPAYQWMGRQMTMRGLLGTGRYPLWAWARCPAVDLAGQLVLAAGARPGSVVVGFEARRRRCCRAASTHGGRCSTVGCAATASWRSMRSMSARTAQSAQARGVVRSFQRRCGRA